MSSIIQIVPRRAIEPEGVGDYARLIAERLFEYHGIRTIFVTGSPLPPDQRLHDAWETHELPDRAAKTLAAMLERIGGSEQMPILLHLSGYGYQRKGTPFWLAKGLERWRRGNPNTPLVTIFHEIHATGAVTGSAFWLAPFQRQIARRILRISTAAVTTMARYGAMLDTWTRRGQPPISVCPVFSTIGESDVDALPMRRAPILAVFGRGNMAETLYGRDRSVLEAFIVREKIEAIIDIGKRPTPVPEVVAGIPVEPLGEAPAATIRSRLIAARFGMMHYNADFLAKSSIFAAYCAFGVIPVCLSESDGSIDGVQPGKTYLKLGAASLPMVLDPSTLDTLQAAAHEWYMPHSLGPTVRIIHDALQGRPIARVS